MQREHLNHLMEAVLEVKMIVDQEDLGKSKSMDASASAAARDEYVSVVFYDLLQKEVINTRKSLHEKHQFLKDRDISIEMLSKKIDTLSKAMETETKKLRREKALLEKEVAAVRVEKEQGTKTRRLKGTINNQHI